MHLFKWWPLPVGTGSSRLIPALAGGDFPRRHAVLGKGGYVVTRCLTWRSDILWRRNDDGHERCVRSTPKCSSRFFRGPTITGAMQLGNKHGRTFETGPEPRRPYIPRHVWLASMRFEACHASGNTPGEWPRRDCSAAAMKGFIATERDNAGPFGRLSKGQGDSGGGGQVVPHLYGVVFWHSWPQVLHGCSRP